MPRTSFSEMNCSIARTADVIGQWWTPLVLRDIAVGITRFDAIQRNLGISRKVLSERLSRLVDQGVLRREAYQQAPARHDYFLTDKGTDLALVLLAMQAWGDKWVFGEGSEPVVVRHESCGADTSPVPACSSCGERLSPSEITPVAGPGARPGPGTAATFEALARLGQSRAATAG